MPCRKREYTTVQEDVGAYGDLAAYGRSRQGSAAVLTDFYTAPWTVTIRQPLVLDSELIDYYCLENEKDWAHMVKSR